MNQTTKLKLLYLLQAILAVIIVPVIMAFGVYLLLLTKKIFVLTMLMLVST